MLPTLEDLQRSQGYSAFRTVKETYSQPITDTTEVNQCRSTADCEEHDRWKCSTRILPSDELLAKSSSTAKVSHVSDDEHFSQLQDVEPDDNNNGNTAPLNVLERLHADKRPLQQTDDLDVSARLNCIANCSQSIAASDPKSNDAPGACRSKVTDNSSDEDGITRVKQVSSSVSATETTFLDEGSARTAFELNGKSLVPTSTCELDYVRLRQQLNQSMVDQRQDASQTASEREPVGELQQQSSSCASKMSLYEHLTTYDAEIPEIPVHIRVTPDECQALNQQLARAFEIARKTGGDSTRPPAAETESTEGTDCNEGNNEPIWAEVGVTESTCQAMSVECLAEAQKDANVDVCGVGDSDDTADAFRCAELGYGPLDLTCSRVHSTSDADVVSSAGQNVVSKTVATYSNSVHVNMYNYQTSRTAFAEYCVGWTAGSYGAGWPPPPLPCYGHPGVYPGPCPPIFPVPQWQFHGTEPFQPRPRSRGTRRRQRRAPSSCSRVDGIRSTKVSTDSKRSAKRDKVLDTSNSCFPTTGVPDTAACSSSGEVIGNPSSTTSSDPDKITAEHTSVPTHSKKDTDLQVPHDISDPPSVVATSDKPVSIPVEPPQSRGKQKRGRTPTSSVSDQPQCLVEQHDGGSQPTVRGSGNPPSVVATSDNPVSVPVVPPQSCRGGRRRGRKPKNSASDRRQPLVDQQDDGSQPAVRGRKRGRPRKHRGDVPSGRKLPETGVAQVRQPLDNDGKSTTTSVSCDAMPSRGTSRGVGRGRPQGSRRKNLPIAAATSDIRQQQLCPTEAERTEETRETPNAVTSATLTPAANEFSGTSSQADVRQTVHSTSPSLDGENSDVTRDNSDAGPTNCDELVTDSTTFGNPLCDNSDAKSTSTTAADHCHHFPLMQSADGTSCSPIATSGMIIRKRRSRKQGCRLQSNTTTAKNVAGTYEPGDNSEMPESWQPLVTESSITSLLDTLSVASSDHETPERTLASCDGRSQPNASTPFVLLERADLNRFVEEVFTSTFRLFVGEKHIDFTPIL